MKKIIGLIFIIFFLYSFSTITSRRENFTGHWIWKNNNQTFSVHIYKSYDMLKGDYKLTESINGVEVLIYKSNKIIDKVFNFSFGNAISGNSKDGKIFTGLIKDNVLLGDGIHGVKEGQLVLETQSPKKIKWLITPLISYRKKIKKEPENFAIPTDIILTKVLTH